jgi:hypothetical protein
MALETCGRKSSSISQEEPRKIAINLNSSALLAEIRIRYHYTNFTHKEKLVDAKHFSGNFCHDGK